MAKYLVCRKDAIKGGGRTTIASSCFPILVESFHSDAEGIVRMAMNSISKGYVGMHEYVVIPMENACVVSFKPKTQYDVEVRPF